MAQKNLTNLYDFKLNDFKLIYQLNKIGIRPNKSGVPKGSRTPVAAVKGRCPRPLDDGDKYSDVVELGGIEPPTSCMPCKRSPS
jgi:hypothetical protein